MSALAHFKKEVLKELPKADEWLITYSAKVRLRSWIVKNFKKKDLNMAIKYYMNEGDKYVAFTEDEDSMFRIEEDGYLSPYQEMVEADTAAFYEAVKTTAGAVVDRVKKVAMVVCFG
jgi:hypothetical protein